MIRLFTETSKLLQPGDCVKFVGQDFTDEIREGEMFRITRVQQITFDYSVIIPSGDFTQIDLSAETGIGLYPTNSKSLFEILVGLKGGKDMLLYIQIPAGKYLGRLEKAELYPDPAVPQLRYISPITADDTPVREPKLRIHTVKDFEPIIFQIYNDGSDYEKLVFHFLINRCYMERLTPEEAAEVEKYREILHYEHMRW
ncbi:MAG: hypothetical protein ACTSPB_15675 [Candidatus Thorarchaeota archaeon]